MAYDCETPKESESPRFQAILRVTSGPRKRIPADIKSFSHELNSKGVRPFPFWKPRGLNNLEVGILLSRVLSYSFPGSICFSTYLLWNWYLHVGGFGNDTWKV